MNDNSPVLTIVNGTTLTATTFSGNLTGNVTGDLTGTATTATRMVTVDGSSANIYLVGNTATSAGIWLSKSSI